MAAHTPMVHESTLAPSSHDDAQTVTDDVTAWPPLLALLSATDQVPGAFSAGRCNKAYKPRDREKNGAMCMALPRVLSLAPQCVCNPVEAQPLRAWSTADVQIATETVAAHLHPPRPYLVLLAILSTGAYLATQASVAGTGYRQEQRVRLCSAVINIQFELSIRSSFQQRKKPNVATAALSKNGSNSNRLQIQQESDLLIQSVPNFSITTVAPNASQTKKHYPYLRLVQRAGGPLLAQQACGSEGQFIVTHRLLWGIPGTDIATLEIDRPLPHCKHGCIEEHDACKFHDAYTIKEVLSVPDGQGGWTEQRCEQYSLRILGEKRTDTDDSSQTSLDAPRKRKVSTHSTVSSAATAVNSDVVAVAVAVEHDTVDENDSNDKVPPAQPSLVKRARIMESDALHN